MRGKDGQNRERTEKQAEGKRRKRRKIKEFEMGKFQNI